MATDIEAEALPRDFVVRCLRALDERDYETLAAGFADDGVWVRGSEHLMGPDAVLAAMGRRPTDLETQHLAFNMVVDADGADGVVVRYTIAAYAQTADKPLHLHAMLRATDRLTRSATGWCFAHRSVEPAFSIRD